jgi:hypothetical protein
MVMRKLRPHILLLALVPALAACDGLFDLDINTDPNAATSVPGDLLLPTVQARVATQRTIEFGPDNALISQIWASGGTAGVFLDPERYIISSFITGNTWSILFTDGLKNLGLIRDQALDATPAVPNAAAQAEIMAAYIFWTLTSLFEKVPFTQALQGTEFPQPVFDEQETVLRGVIQKLDDAIALVDLSAGAVPGIEFGDLVYGGDMESWIRFANSLKLRTLMMIRNRDTGVDAQITALLNQPLIRTNAQEAAVPFFAASFNDNPLHRLHTQYGGFYAQNASYFIRAGQTLVNLMAGLNDPRLDTYFERPVNFDTAEYEGTAHVGSRSGVSNWIGPHSSVHALNIFRRDWPNRFITAAEVLLFEAEFLARTGQLGPAYTAYRAGVEAALNWFDGKPGAISAAAKTAYLAGLPQSFPSPTAALTAIHAQQYIEVFDRAPENWVHTRRTRYPALPLPEQAVLGDLIRRFPYPPDELSANPNAPAQTALDVPMWFEPVN